MYIELPNRALQAQMSLILSQELAALKSQIELIESLLSLYERYEVRCGSQVHLDNLCCRSKLLVALKAHVVELTLACLFVDNS